MFDKVLLVNVVYFFDFFGRDIAEVYRVLRSGGRGMPPILFLPPL